MSIREMIDALDEEAEAERQAILERAKKEARRIVAQARAEAERIRAKAENRFAGDLENERNRFALEAQIEGRMRLAALRGKLVGEVFDAAKERLREEREQPEYRQIFVDLVSEAWEAANSLDSERLLFVNPKDEALARDILKQLGPMADVVVDAGVDSGVALASPDRRQRLRNTLESRLERLAPRVRMDVGRILFRS